MNAHEFQKFYKRNYLPLCMYALRLIEDTDAADDVVQSSFIRVWEMIREGKEIRNPENYLYRVIRNVTLAQLKESNRFILIDDNSAEMEISEEEIETAERDARLWKAIDSMPPRRREIFLMSKRDGLTYTAIGEELGLSVKTIENQMSKALASLRGNATLIDTSFVILFL